MAPNANTAAVELLTVPEVATELRRSEWSVRDYIARGFLPAIQAQDRGRLCVAREDLNNFLTRHLRDPRKRSVLRRTRG